MYKTAYSYNEEVVFYFDEVGNKYVSQGGNLAWRINNPGLVRSHNHFSGKNGSIGSCKGFAIFSHPMQGRKALSDLLKAKKYCNSKLKKIAKLYAPNDPEKFLLKIASVAGVDSNCRVCSLSAEQFKRLLIAIEKFCGYALVGNEKFSLLPKIYAHIEGDIPGGLYLIEGGVSLSKDEAIRRISEHLLDGVIVHRANGGLHLRSRPYYSTWNIRISEQELPPIEGEIDTILRSVGEKRKGQCIWAFINGIWNTKESSLESASIISEVAGGEQVFSMPNDTVGKVKDILACLLLKGNGDTPAVRVAAKFFRHLLSLSHIDDLNLPVIIFTHSMGAIISEHALKLLKHEERQQLRIYTFGGGSLIASDKCHVDSHNFASAMDPICLMGSPNLRALAMRRYQALKDDLTEEQMIFRWAQEDAMLNLDSTDAEVIQSYEDQRCKYYAQQLRSVKNVTIIDPGHGFEHAFCNECYQSIIRKIVSKFRGKSLLREKDLAKILSYAMT